MALPHFELGDLKRFEGILLNLVSFLFNSKANLYIKIVKIFSRHDKFPLLDPELSTPFAIWTILKVY